MASFHALRFESLASVSLMRTRGTDRLTAHSSATKAPLLAQPGTRTTSGAKYVNALFIFSYSLLKPLTPLGAGNKVCREKANCPSTGCHLYVALVADIS